MRLTFSFFFCLDFIKFSRCLIASYYEVKTCSNIGIFILLPCKGGWMILMIPNIRKLCSLFLYIADPQVLVLQLD